MLWIINSPSLFGVLGDSIQVGGQFISVLTIVKHIFAQVGGSILPPVHFCGASPCIFPAPPVPALSAQLMAEQDLQGLQDRRNSAPARLPDDIRWTVQQCILQTSQAGNKEPPHATKEVAFNCCTTPPTSSAYILFCSK